MPTRTMPFEIAEFESRLRKVQSQMEDAGYNALIVLAEGSMTYLTGYEGYSDYMPQLMLVLTDHDAPILILREMDVHCATATTFLKSSDIEFYEEALVDLSMANVWRRLGEMARSRIGSGRIALDSAKKAFPWEDREALFEGLGTTDIGSGAGWMAAARRVKSSKELQYMAEAAAIVDNALERGIGKIGVGVRECEVGAEIMHRICLGTDDIPGGAPSFTASMASGPIANAPHLKWSDGVFAGNSQVNFEIGAFRHRYTCALSRTAFIGRPGDRLKMIDEVVRESFEATLPSLRAGNSCGEVDRVFRATFERHGIRKPSRIGYGIGIDWSDGTYTLQRGSQHELELNSTIHLIIGIWEPAEGYVFSETIRIGENRGETLSRMPRKLFLIDA
jgi:Xaa-Pro dipeptidase